MLITEAITEAGIRLLGDLIQQALNKGEQTNHSRYTVLELWLTDLVDYNLIAQAVHDAQEQFVQSAGAYSSGHSQFLQLTADLIDCAGTGLDAFLEYLWGAYLFHSPGVAEYLWDLYPEIQREITLKAGRHFPASWDEMVFPMQEFLAYVERNLIAQNPDFEDIFSLQEFLGVVDSLTDPASVTDGRQYFSPLAGQFDTASLTIYLQSCINKIGSIDYRGYPRSKNTAILLKDIYIPVKLVPLTDYAQLKKYTRYQMADYDDPEWYIYQEPLGYRELLDHPGILVHEAVTKHPELLIISEGGGGKTTLLRYLALEYARVNLDALSQPVRQEVPGKNGNSPELPRPVPIYIDLADFVERWDANITLEKFATDSIAHLVQDENIAALLKALLDEGRCMLLLDGLDQVVTDENRRALVSRVSEAAANWRSVGNRIVVTSQLSGYHTAPLLGSFVGYLIQPFDRYQIRSFVYNWRRVLVEGSRPKPAGEKVMRQTYSDAMALAREITSNPRLLATVNTPLLLRLLTGIYQAGMFLPAQPAAVYQLATNVLLSEWQLPRVEGREPSVLEHELIPLLGALAHTVHSLNPSGLISEADLRDMLKRILGEMRPTTGDRHIAAAVDRLISILRNRPGVLVEMETQRFGFIFQGVQEYFAARHIISSYRLAARRIRDDLHNPRWNNVIALAVGYKALTSFEDATELIETAILMRGEGSGEFGRIATSFDSLLKRDLFYAARLLGKGVEVRPERAEWIVSQLMDFWLHGDRGSLGRFTPIFDQARRLLMSLDGTSAGAIALRIAVANLKASSEHVQAYAVDALTFFPSLQDQAQEELVELGTKAPLLARRAAVQALGRMKDLSFEAYFLLMLLTADENEQVSQKSREVLCRSAPIPDDVIQMWMGYLISMDPLKQRLSLRRLPQIGALPPRMIHELLNLMNSRDEEIQQLTVAALAAASNLDEDVLQVICNMLDHADSKLLSGAVGIFARPVDLPAPVVAHLVTWSADPDVRVRRSAVRALAECRNNTHEVLNALLARLDDPADNIRILAIEPLVVKGLNYNPAAHMLRHAAKDAIYQVRQAVARALRHVAEPDDNLQYVLHLLLSDQEVAVREEAIRTIAHMSNPGDMIIDYLIALVDLPDHPITRSAVRSLASLSHLPERALLALVQALDANWEQMGEMIADCLKEHDLSQHIINRLSQMAASNPKGSLPDQYRPPGLRALALDVLGRSLDSAPAFILPTMWEAADHSENMLVRIAAFGALAQAREITSSVAQMLLRALKDPLVEIRCAAAIALGYLVRRQPDPPLQADDMVTIARAIQQMLSEIPACDAWEPGSQLQSQLLRALGWIVPRTRKMRLQLGAQSEDLGRYLDQ